MMMDLKVKAIVIGASSGGLQALCEILPPLPKDFMMPIFIVQHVLEKEESFLAKHLNRMCQLNVVEGQAKQPILGGTVYVAPPGYHMLIENENELALSNEAEVNYSRPSIDVLFESAAEVYQQFLVGILLTGANSDGAIGLQLIHRYGGTTVVQNPRTAEFPEMPSAAIRSMKVDYVLNLDKMSQWLIELNQNTLRNG